MTENKGFTFSGAVNEEVLRAAAAFARQAMRKWLMDIVAECNVKEFDRTKGVYINVTIYDFEGYHVQATALEVPNYHMRALRHHYLNDDLSHTMGIQVQGLNRGDSFTIDFRDMTAIGGMTEPELRTVHFYDETWLPLHTLVNLDGFEVEITDLTEQTDAQDDGTSFYRQYFTLQIKNRLKPDTPYILQGKSAKRNHPYGTERAHVDGIRALLAEHLWNL